MNLSGNTFVAIAADGRLFGLDPQLLFDAAVTAVNVFVLFLLLTFILFNPVRNMLKKRQDKKKQQKLKINLQPQIKYQDFRTGRYKLSWPQSVHHILTVQSF